MNGVAKILSLTVLVAAGVTLFAQQKGTATTGKKPLVPYTYLGHSEYKGGPIPKVTFDGLLKQGVSSRDSMGNKYKVVGFRFSYAERTVYEDSVGNLQMMTDLMYEYCPGDTITTAVASMIYDHTKPGDTVYIDDVSVVKYLDKSGRTQPETNAFAARGMKCVITK